MTIPDLSHLRALAMAASPGPWTSENDNTVIIDPESGRYILGDPDNQPYDEDMEYIAALSPDVALALLDEVERLRAVLTKVRGKCASIAYGMPSRALADSIAALAATDGGAQ